MPESANTFKKKKLYTKREISLFIHGLGSVKYIKRFNAIRFSLTVVDRIEQQLQNGRKSSDLDTARKHLRHFKHQHNENAKSIYPK